MVDDDLVQEHKDSRSLRNAYVFLWLSGRELC